MKKLMAVIAVFLLSTSLAAQNSTHNPTDFLAAIDTAIQHKGGACDGMYQYTYGNALPQGWLEQTPVLWGKKPSDLVPWEHSKQLAVDIGNMIAKAQTVVDITTLAPGPDGYFAGEIKRGLTEVAKSGKPVIVRILVGTYPGGSFDAVKYLEAITPPLAAVPGNRMIVYAGGMRTDDFSWNHAKIVQVDGKYALVGGHNLWPHDYLGPQPTHDVSMMVEGPAAYAAFKFNNVLWDRVRWCVGTGPCAYREETYRWTAGHMIKEVPPGVTLAVPSSPGHVPIIALGRSGKKLNSCSKDWHPSDTAMLAMLSHASKSIRLSQQDLYLGKCGSPIVQYWEPGMKELARAVARNVDVQVVVTSYKARVGDAGSLYTNCIDRANVWHYIWKEVANITDLKGEALKKRMHDKFHLATIRFGDAKTWDNGFEFANHAKVMIVDDSAFYIGSSNFYSSDLQEFGYVVQNPAAAHTLMTDYWDQLWKYSKATEFK